MLSADRRTLKNGLRVVVLNLPHLHSVSHALMVRAGPRYESESTSGISHLVEHLVFRGTERHPESYLLNTAIEELGGEVNGLTQRDASTIHMTLPPRTAMAGLELLGDICTRPLLHGLEIERNVVIEEILDTSDASGVETDIDTISRRVLWSGHPLGLPVAGTADHVRRLAPAQCRAHFERTFVATNAVLCVAGPVDAELVFETAERAFGAMPRGARLEDGSSPVAAKLPSIHIQETEDAQVAVLLSYPAPHENHPEFPALLLLRRVLDDGLAARLRQAICEQRGLAYSLSATIDAYSDAGVLDLDASCAPRKLVATGTQMLAVLEELAANGITQAELDRVKTRHQADLEFILDDPSELCGWYGASELVGAHATYDERLAATLRVTVEDVNKLARRLFDPSRALLTLVGPADPASVAKLERALERPAGSSVWIGRKRRPRLRVAG